MSGPGAVPLFINTGAFYARLDERDENHARARSVFEGIRAGDFAYRPLYTTGYVLAERVTLALVRADRSLAATALDRIRASNRVEVLHPDGAAFSLACEEFQYYDDQDISLVDHVTGVLADDHGVEHVFTFDPDDFRTLGFAAVPADTGESEADPSFDER